MTFSFSIATKGRQCCRPFVILRYYWCWVFYFLHQLSVPVLAILADERVFQELVHPHAQIGTKGTRRVTDTPPVIVEGFKSIVLADADGVQVAADRLFERSSSGQVGLLNT